MTDEPARLDQVFTCAEFAQSVETLIRRRPHFIIVADLIVDLLYAVVDPKVRYS